MNWCKLLLCTLCIPVCSFAQKDAFTIVGKINDDRFRMIFIEGIVYDNEYYKCDLNDSAIVLNQQFTFKGTVSYPHPFRITAFDSASQTWVSTEMFFLEIGKHVVMIDSLTEGLIIHLNTPANKEYEKLYLPTAKLLSENWQNALDQIDSVLEEDTGQAQDSLMRILWKIENQCKVATDSFLLQYVDRYPDSYIGLFKLLQKFHIQGYSPIQSEIFSLLAPHLKQTLTGTRLQRALNGAAIAAVGEVFPKLLLAAPGEQQADIALVKGNRFTLVDFWYSKCGPCISQFDDLKKLYASFGHQGFEIIGISTDKEIDMSDWTAAIKKYELGWKQYIDKNGMEADRLAIYAYPTNFLLDGNGRILQRNITLDALTRFLQEHLR